MSKRKSKDQTRPEKKVRVKNEKLKKIRSKKTEKPIPQSKASNLRGKQSKRLTADITNILVKGKFIGNERGFGFVVPQKPEAEGIAAIEDIFIPPHATNNAIHGDEVLCRLTATQSRIKSHFRTESDDQRQSGHIVEITHREPLIGTYVTRGGEGYIRPIENKIPYVFAVLQKNQSNLGLADGHRVVFVTPIPKKVKDNRLSVLPCYVTEIIGHIHDPGVDVLTLVHQYKVSYIFPEDVILESQAIPDAITAECLHGRKDFCSHQIFTIDGEDTKDIDDAISLTMTPEGYYKLGVHIADVSHYVKPSTPTDLEALNRGTSIYLADRVIPMLPHSLSSGICSLFPGVDRLTVSCIMTVDADGHVVSYEITPSVINSKRRWTYKEVQGILDANSASECEETQKMDSRTSKLPWPELFAIANQLREKLYQKRQKRGALDFDIPEAKIRVDKDGHPISVDVYERNQATGIIEEFMILANETIATHCQVHNIPTIYRAHEAPSPEKLARLTSLIRSFGLTDRATASAKSIQRLLLTASKGPIYYTVAMSVLTSMPQAFYTPSTPKHFGLGSEAYCHFTSPIRRYADLQVHREIKASVRKTQYQARMPAHHLQHHDNTNPEKSGILGQVASICSETEREAEALERDVTQLKKVQFMQNQKGQVFKGIISGITPWGAYIMLPNTIEGLIPSQYLKHANYKHDKKKNIYFNKHKSASISMGDTVQVRLAQTNEEERKLIFTLEIVVLSSDF